MAAAGKRIIFIISQENFRDEEYLVPLDVFKKAGIKVTTASITRNEAGGSRGARVVPDISVREADPDQFDGLVIAGGSGSPKLADYPEVLNIIKRFRERGRVVASICLAGYVLARAGILAGVKATVFPSDFALAEYRKSNVGYAKEHVVEDGKIITADGPESAREFAERIVAQF